MKQGNIVRVELPAPKGTHGHEQFGRRPAVVIQADNATPNLATVVVVPLTSNQGSLRFPGSFLIEATKENGLDTQSVVLTAQIRAIDKRRIIDIIGHLDGDDLSKLKRRLGEILGI